MRWRGRGLGQTAAATGLVAFVLLYVFPCFPTLNNPNENVRFYMTASLVEDGTYAIDAVRARWGRVNDGACVDLAPDGARSPCTTPEPAPGVVRHRYSVKAPGTSWLGVPAYALYRALRSPARFDRVEALWAVRVGGTILPMLVFFWCFHRWLGRFTRHRALRDAVFFSTALGSLLCGYSLLFVSHATGAAAAFGAFMLLERAHHRPAARSERAAVALAALAGLLAAGASFLEYHAIFVSVLLCAYALVALRGPRRFTRYLAFVLGALVPTVAMMQFQYRAFGNPLSPGHLFVEANAWRALYHHGLFGADRFRPEAAFRLLFDRRLGLLTMTPILLIAPWGAARLLRKGRARVDAAVALVCVLATYAFICSMNIWDGGWVVGPRYLAVIVPFVAWFALVGLDRLAQHAPRLAVATAAGALLAGLVASGIPSVYYPHLPPGLDAPLVELFPVLLSHGFAPYNAGAFLGLFGTWSMVPVFAVWGLCFAWVLYEGRRVAAVDRVAPLGARAGALTTAAALATAGALLGPSFLAPRPSAAADAAVAFITRTWAPAGHDRAASLRASLAASVGAMPLEARTEEARRLAQTYRAEHRDEEANLVERRYRLAAPVAPEPPNGAPR
ncbi:MAG: hypothetical protein KC543_02975 [Myxococcales bacterium]|nr:hypothetical protein [Myxococcales bacterium]